MLKTLVKITFYCNFCREFSKRVDPDLPFYYWTINERYRALGDHLPSFNDRPVRDDDGTDDGDSSESDNTESSDHTESSDSDDDDDSDPENHPLRLHRLTLNRREDSSIFVPGRSFLPVRNQTTIRQRLFRPAAALPPCPNTPSSDQDDNENL